MKQSNILEKANKMYFCINSELNGWENTENEFFWPFFHGGKMQFKLFDIQAM